MNSDVQTLQPPGIMDSAEHAVKAAKKLAEGNLNVFTAEAGVAIGKLKPRLAGLALSATLLALGLTAFLVFVIIGLGVLLDGRYWLSSLLVAAVACLTGGPLLMRSLSGISEIFQFDRTIRSVDRTVEAAKQTFEEIKTATAGEKS